MCFYFLWDKVSNWYSLTDFNIIAVGAAIGGFLSWGLGGFDGSFKALCMLMVLDFATGSFAATRVADKEGNKGLSSRVGFWGLVKKVSIVGFVAFGNLLDAVMGANMLRNMFICGFGLNEAVSIVENIDRCGWGAYVPRWIRGIIWQLRSEKVSKYETIARGASGSDEKG